MSQFTIGKKTYLIILSLILIYKRCQYLEIPGQHWASADGQKFEDDRRPGEDLVSEPEDKMEVSLDDQFNEFWVKEQWISGLKFI